jgi:phosphatidylinositol-3-phosphatase
MLFKNRLPNLVRRFLSPVLAMVGCLLVAATATAGPLGDVFVIDMENHNLTQPGSVTSPAQLQGNAAAPYLNSLMTPGNPNAAQTSWASNYYNVAAGVHPSLPNYLWQEAGTNFGVTNDNEPFGTGGANQGNATNLSGLLQRAGISWKSYQEDIDINTSNQVLARSQWTVPLTNSSGTFTPGSIPNAYNGSNQYNFATKHDGQLYFNATNGGDNTTPSNPQVSHYAPLQQLQSDLASNSVARYNLITPDQYNDMHSPLPGGFTYHGVTYAGTSDQAAVAQGDNFLSMIVPMIMNSAAYKHNGAIVIWYDETEGGDTKQFTLPEIVISSLAKGDAYDNTLDYTHSSDLKSWEELFGVYAPGGQFLGDANTPGTYDLSDLFVAGALAGPVPELRSIVMMSMGLGIGGLYGLMRLVRRKAA